MGTNEPFTIDVSKFDGYEKGTPIRLVLTADWHIELIASVWGAIRQMHELEARKPNTYFIHDGDLFNAVTLNHPHARKEMGGSIWEFTRPEFLSPEWLDYAVEEALKLARHRNPNYIVFHDGNHDRRLEMDGHQIIKGIAKELNAKFGGIETPWTLKADGKKLDIWSGHCYGGGGGEYVGTLQNRLERTLGRSAVDLMLWGHFHNGTVVDAPSTGRIEDGIGIVKRKVGAITPSMVNVYRRGQVNHWASRFGAYRGIGYALVKWVPQTGFLNARIVNLDDTLPD